MAGYFELVDAPDGGYRIRMLDGAGSLMAVSVTFPTKRAAVAGVAHGPRDCRYGPDPRLQQGCGAAAVIRDAGPRCGGPAAKGHGSGASGQQEASPNDPRPQSGDGPAESWPPARLAGEGPSCLTLTGRWWTPPISTPWPGGRRSARPAMTCPWPGIHRCVGMGGAASGGQPPAGGPGQGPRTRISWPPSGDFRHVLAVTARASTAPGTCWPSAMRWTGRGPGVVRAEAGSRGSAGRPSAADAFIDAATSANDAKESKPAAGHPGGGAGSRGRSGLPMPSTWAMPCGISWRRSKLGIPAIGVTCGGTSEAELRDAGAVEVYAGPRELLDNLRDSAIGRLLAG